MIGLRCWSRPVTCFNWNIYRLYEKYTLATRILYSSPLLAYHIDKTLIFVLLIAHFHLDTCFFATKKEKKNVDHVSRVDRRLFDWESVFFFFSISISHCALSVFVINFQLNTCVVLLEWKRTAISHHKSFEIHFALIRITCFHDTQICFDVAALISS